MDRRDFASGRDLPGLRIAHLMPEADRLYSEIEQFAGDLDDVARQQFALVADGLLHGGHAAAAVTQIAWRQSEPREQIPVRLVELAGIPHDVHVADVIALPRINRAAIARHSLHRRLPDF